MGISVKTFTGKDSSGRNVYSGQTKVGKKERSSGGGYETAEVTGRDVSSSVRETQRIESEAKQTQAAIDKINQERIDAGKPTLVGTTPPPQRAKPLEPTTVRTMGLEPGQQGPLTQAQTTARQQELVTSPILNRPVTRGELEASQASAARIEAAKAAAREEDRLGQITEYQRLKTRSEYVTLREKERDVRNEAGGAFTLLSRTEKKFGSEGAAGKINTRAMARAADTASYYGTYRPVELIERKAREGNRVARAALFPAELGKAANQLVIDTTLNPESIVLQGAGEVAFRGAAQGYQELKFIGKKEVATADIVSEQFLSGKNFYPKATPQQTVAAAQETGIVYSSAPARFNSGKAEVVSLTNQARIKAGLATSKEETGGIFAAPKASPGFTRLISKGTSTEAASSESILRIPTLGNTATINRIETSTARLPKQYRGNLAKGNLFLDTEAAVKYPGKAFSSPLSELGKTESEVIIPGGSVLQRGNKLNPTKQYSFIDRVTKRDFEFYTRVPKVFGEPEAGLQKVAIRDYTNVGAKANKALLRTETTAAKNRQFTTASKAYSSSAGREASSGILPLVIPSSRVASRLPSSSTTPQFKSNTNLFSSSKTKSAAPSYTSLRPSSSSVVPSYSSKPSPISSYTPPPSSVSYPKPRSSTYPRPVDSTYRIVIPPSRPYPNYSEVTRATPLPRGFTAGVGGGGVGGRGSQTQRGGGDKFSYAPTFTAAFFGIKASKKQRKAILEASARGQTYTGSEVIRPLL